MFLEKSTLVSESERHIICFSGNIDEYYYDSLNYGPSSGFDDTNDMIQDRMIQDKAKLQNVWHRDINYYGRKYIPGWTRRGLHRLDISFDEFKTFLYFIKMSGYCNFAKRDEIYDSLTIMTPESTRDHYMSRKRFHLIIIAWHYVNQVYFRREQQLSYQQLSPFYQVEDKVIRRFESYYRLRTKTKKIDL
jgi:hypothetical protein